MAFLSTVTQGGQISIHSLRMLKQVFKIAFSLGFVVWAALLILEMMQVPVDIYYCLGYFSLAHLCEFLFLDQINVDPTFWKSLTHKTLAAKESVAVNQVIHYTTPYVVQLKNFFVFHAGKAGKIASLAVFSVLVLFFIKGKISSKKQLISGNSLSSARKLAWRLKLTRKASSLKIGDLPLIKNSETQHLLVTGGTGSGKTNCFHHLLPEMRHHQHRAIIVDTTGALVERYYNPETDVILNPLDPRTAFWNPWTECEDDLSYKALAESLIPSTFSEDSNYWRSASQSVFSSVLQKLHKTPKIVELVKMLLKEPLPVISEYVKGTPAAAHLDLSSERTAASIRSVMSAYVECLDHLKDVDNPFSIKQWIKEEKPNGWLFLTCETKHRTALVPLLTCWFSIAVRGLLELPPDFKRRLWFVIDELPSLNRIKDLDTLLTEGRKYGGCGLLALQSPAQLDHIYGRETAKIIMGNCNTKIVFSEQNPEIANKISLAFGQKEIKEYQKSLSYGANDVRDGVNLNLQTKNLPLVTATEIQFLKPNQAYIRLAGNYPIVKLQLKIAKKPTTKTTPNTAPTTN
jgi:type IV conjugative transfer system coupling protein TraD